MRIESEKLNKDARIWIYQNNKAIPAAQIGLIQEELEKFIQGWSAHQQPLLASAVLLHERFIVLMVDENQNAVSGCSIDASVSFIRSLEQRYDLELFDRFTFSYEKDGKIYTVPKSQFAELYRDGEINSETLVFDNLIKTKEDLDEKWKKPLGKSWLRRFV